MNTTPPNILFLHSHNTGRYIQPYGHAVATPHMQTLAEEGVLFRRAFAAAPTCSPSRASFMTGAWPHCNGMLGLAHRGFPMADYRRHLAQGLQEMGYETVLSGVEHTARDSRDVGYSRILSSRDVNDKSSAAERDVAAAAAEFLKEAHQKPFFLSVGLQETHRPFPKADAERYPDQDPRFTIPPRPFPDTPETRADMADFKAAARQMDDNFGQVLAALEDAGLAETTIVFCFADHGLQFPLNMCNLTDHGIGVYLIIRGPGFTGGRVVDGMVSLIDLAPTVYQAAGESAPEHVRGTALQSLVAGQVDRLHDYVYAEVNYHASYEPMRCVRSDRYKYIRRYDGRRRPVLPNVDDTPSKDYLLSLGWAEVTPDAEALYDLLLDPDERANIIDRPEAAEILKDLRSRLDDWMKATEDPLLPDGVVPAPVDARVNDPNGASPNDPIAPATWAR